MLRLALLGRPQITLNDHLITDFVSDKALVLLCYLAVQGQPCSRESLATLLWGEMLDERAKANLRMALYNLQKLVPDYLVTDRKTAAFASEQPYWLDVAQFEQLVQKGEDWATAVALYRDEFLTGITIEDAPELADWLRVQRERHRWQAIVAWEKLADQHTRRGRWTEAMAATRQLLHLEPWREAAHQRLMRLLARTGDMNAALAQYEICREVLSAELGVAPTPETTQLATRIRRARPARTNLPPAPTPLQGRTAELGQLHHWLVAPTTRLITIGGQGGVGKTRLALACAAAHTHDFLDGVVFVPLAGLLQGSGLVAAIAEALALPLNGTKESKQQLIDFLQHKEMLLLLDNVEQIVAAAADLLVTLLESTTAVKCLVTSREFLNVRWEFRLPLAGLDYPAAADKDSNYPALRLFAEIAGRVQPTFAWVAQEAAVSDICRLLEGLPLGIELAAALVDKVPTADIAARMTQTMDIVATTMRDVPARHRSLRAVFEQSWQLLSEQEQAVLVRLSLFRGGFTVVAASAVAEASPPVLERLQRQSLLRPSAHDRYDLHEVIRQYAAEKLAIRIDATATTQQFAHYYSQMLAGQAGALRQREAVAALTRLRQDVDNVRVAWQWITDQQQVALIEPAFASLALFYEMGNLYEEGLAAMSQGVTAVRDLVKWPEDSWFLELLANQVHFLNLCTHFDEAVVVAETAAALAQSHKLEYLAASVYLRWGQAFKHRGLFVDAFPYLTKALTLAQDGKQLLTAAATCLSLGSYYDDKGELDLAQNYLKMSLEIYQELDDIWGQARVLRQLGAMSGFAGQYEASHLYYGEALDYFQQLNDREGQAAIYNNLGSLYINQGQHALARQHLDLALNLRRQLGAEQHAINTYINLGSVTGLLGQYDEAEAYLEEVLAIVRTIGNRRAEGVILLFLGYARLCQHQFAAEAIFAEALRLTADVGALSFAAVARFRLGTIAWIGGQLEKALPLFTEALRTAREEKFSYLILDVLADLGLLYQEMGRSETAITTSNEAVATAKSYDRPAALAYALTRQADIVAGQAKWAQAAAPYKEAAQIWVSAGQTHLAVEAWGGLAYVAHKENNLANALTYVELILAEDERHQLQGVLRPFPIYLTCYQVLEQSGDSRARPFLQTVQQRLRQQASRWPDEAWQRSFLERVPAHQTLLRLT